LSAKVGQALADRRLIIEQIGGAGKLAYKLTMLDSALCFTHVLLDNDQAGTNAYKQAIDSGVANIADITIVNCQGMRSSELEDTFNVSSYSGAVLEKFGVQLGLNVREFRGVVKWSERVKNCFESQGKLWSDKLEIQVKTAVAEAVALVPDQALNDCKRHALDALVRALENKLDARNTP
jgi:putative ATP-dependent endonuclease of OLD family